MTSPIALIHFISIAFSTVCAAFGVSLGQGIATQQAFDAINRQPAGQPAITRTVIFGLALIETAAILGLLISFLLFFKQPTTLPAAVGEIGMAIAIGIPGLVIGWAASQPPYEAFIAIARQPFLSRQISNFMLLAQSLSQTPLIFGFIIALIIRNKLSSVTTVSQALALVGAGVAIGFGCVGPALGGGLLAKVTTKSIGLNRLAFSRLFTFTFISQAIIETPVIFASIISFLLTTRYTYVPDHWLYGLAYLAFGATIGFGTFGAGISSGRSAAAGALQIAYNPQSYNFISRASMLAQGLIDTCAVYAFIIALWLVITPLV